MGYHKSWGNKNVEEKMFIMCMKDENNSIFH
jgi:hypothetical protein